MKLLLTLAALCQIALLMDGALIALIYIGMPNGALSPSTPVTAGDAAIARFLPLLALAVAVYLLFNRHPFAWYSLVGVNAIAVLAGIFVNEPSGVKAMFWIPAGAALLLLLTPPLHARFDYVYDEAQP